MIDAILVFAAYFLGACPFGLLVARGCGVDIRAVGSGNIGATNVFRMVSKGAGISVFFLDAVKGFIPAWAFPLAARWLGTSTLDVPSLGLLCGLAAIAGHNWPVYLAFRGGKGVATSAGVLIGLAPFVVLVGLVSWILLLGITGYVSVASMGAAVAVPVAGWILYGNHGLLLPLALTALGILIISRHHTNIRRLVNGTEHSFEIWGARETTSRDEEESESEGERKK